MSVPQRIQQRRTKGWRKPDGVVAVGRGTRWGNPYSLEKFGRAWAVVGYRAALVEGRLVRATVDDVRRELSGRDLMCWCPLDQRCHADVLLEIANR